MARKIRGRTIKLSFSRRCLIDFLHFSKKVSLNSVSAEKYMDLAPLIAARQVCPVRISWYAIFLKAFSNVSSKFPELRQAYFPWIFPHIYEYKRTAGMVAIEREVFGETMVVYLRVESPEKQSLQDLHEYLKHAKDCDPNQIQSLKDFILVNRMPFLFRRFLWWLGMNVHSFRNRFFGTFGLTGIGLGVRSLSVKSPMASTFVFDMSMTDIKPLVRLFWDHRVFDGVVVINMLQELQRVLNEEIAFELEAISASMAEKV